MKIIGRSSGRSAVAAAAYRSGECITNGWDGVMHDFRKKKWVEFTEIILPDHAPQNFKDRKTLWNAVEAAEKSKSAQLPVNLKWLCQKNCRMRGKWNL